MNVESAMARYQEIYQSLYKRAPNELRDLGGEWVLVNGARMTVEGAEAVDRSGCIAGPAAGTSAQAISIKRAMNWFGGSS